MTGSNVANRDCWIGREWETREFIFATPDKVGRDFLRFGQWRVKGTVWFRNIQIIPTQPVYEDHNGYKLGTSELIREGVYRALFNFRGHEANSSRCLKAFSTRFNTNRWDLYKDDYIIFQHVLKKGRPDQKNGQVVLRLTLFEQHFIT